MPSNHLILCLPRLFLPSIFPSIRVFSNEPVLCLRWPKYWSFSFNISPSSEYSGPISFRMDLLDLLAVQGTLKSPLQQHNSKASILQCSAFFIVQLSHPYMTTGKTTALTRWTFAGKVMSLLLNMLSRLLIAFLPRSKCLLTSWLQWFWRSPTQNKVLLIYSSLKSATEKAMAPHSNTLAWKIPWTEEPGRLQSTGSRRVRHDWAISLSLFTFMHWRSGWMAMAMAMATHSSVLAWRIPGMGSHRVRHDWSYLAVAVAKSAKGRLPSFFQPVKQVGGVRQELGVVRAERSRKPQREEEASAFLCSPESMWGAGPAGTERLAADQGLWDGHGVHTLHKHCEF